MSDGIHDMKESKLTVRKEKERATDTALTAVSDQGGAGPKTKRGRMEDWYGKGGGILVNRVAHEAICFYFTGTRTAELQCEHPLFFNMLRAVAVAGSSYFSTNNSYVGGAGLLECKQRIEKGFAPITKTWKETGVTIASDMMTDKIGRAQMNIICINTSGAVFQEAVDCKAGTKSGAFIVCILQPIIEKVGPEHVVALCNYVSTGKLLLKKYPHIKIVPCDTRVLDLQMEDIGKMDWAQEVVTVANNMISFLRIHQWTRAFLRNSAPADADGGAQGLGGEGEESADWKEGGVVEEGGYMIELAYKVMRRTDGAAKGVMGALYDIMLQLTEELLALLESADCRLKTADKEGVQEHLRWHWDESLACPLHVVGRILNPFNQDEGIYLKDIECTRVMKAWLSRSRAFVEKYWKNAGGTKGTMKALHEGMMAYIEGDGCFGTEEAIEGRAELKDGKGDIGDVVEVEGLGVRRPGWPCERGWAVWDGVHTARRNRLGSEKVRDLVFVAHNWNVVHSHHRGAAGAGQSGEVRKVGVVEGNIPTLPFREGCKLEGDGEVEVDEDDLCVDEYEHEEDMEEEEEKKESEEDEDE
ncbi:unnamed protein product [Closterium sp. Yama58-4]|nr:unnamed protein product [Closterium sp. Yama58-4]